MNVGLHNGGKSESLGALILRTNRIARAHILSVRTCGRYTRVMANPREDSSRLIQIPSKSSTHQGASSTPIALTEMKLYKEYWDVLGIDGKEVILRRKLLNGVNEEFVLDKEEMEGKGLTGLRAGRRIEVWKDPESGKIQYELQRYTKLAMTPLLQSILDAEKASKQAEGVLQGGQNIAHPEHKAEDNVSEKPDKEKTIIVNVRGVNGEEERVVVSKNNNNDIWACVYKNPALYPGQCIVRTELDDCEMLVDTDKLLACFSKGENVQNIQRGDVILVRLLPQGGLQLNKVISQELDLDFSRLPFTAEELRKYLNS